MMIAAELVKVVGAEVERRRKQSSINWDTGGSFGGGGAVNMTEVFAVAIVVAVVVVLKVAVAVVAAAVTVVAVAGEQ